MRTLLGLAGLAGLLLFAAAFAATFAAPIHYERAARAFVQQQVEARVRERLGERVEALRQPGVAQVAAALSTRYRAESDALQRRLEAGLPERVAAVVGAMLDADCACRQRLADGIREGTRHRIARLAGAQPQLTALIQDRYVAVVEALLRDLRIFTASNALAFALLLATVLLRPAATAQLLLPLGLLLVATLVGSWFYLFRQDWFFTIVHNDYVGFGYSIYLFVVALLLGDVAFNRARLGTALLRAIGGAGGTISPC
ncbi:hypothetical protein H0E84_01440 [Luteimonas sp. SJ-92]|uniref:DUF4239 domain-containing protein n=1 Tax=Luteimonas salinisoli TaxID=2752307 RepID=A0A853J8J5_9GAMM|nr:hypothetical protein [Luteimonas salinisoli]NZA25038.1 hypothetical protein [Luteimonas salinisoli]